MKRHLLLATFLALIASASLNAQDWAKKMFEVSEHDFGTVARGAKAAFAFEIENIYEEDVHIKSVRSSCGCTTPTITKQSLKTWDKSQVVAVYNTRSFLGKKSATLTVVIDQPFYAEVRLMVKGFIRGDVVFEPGVVAFRETDLGNATQQQIRVTYAGRSDWEIEDVRCANQNLEVEFLDTKRSDNRTIYDMLVRLKESAPVGYLNDSLMIITNDSRQRKIPLPVEGRVLSPLAVSPTSLFLGVLEPGETVTKKIVLRAKRPFRVIGIECEDDCFNFTADDEEKKLHFIPITFVAGNELGKIARFISIATDLGDGVAAECLATATISAGNPD